MLCSLTRVLVLSWGVGLVVATLTGNEAAGWLVALAVAGVSYAFQRRMPSGGACAVPEPKRRS